MSEPAERKRARWAADPFYRQRRLDEHKQWRKDNPGWHRRSHLRRLYGMTPEQYEVMFSNQKGLCAICGNSQPNQLLSVDHCHSTGKIRGLLCRNCNRFIGYMRDDPVLFRRAAEYLER